MTRLFTVTAGKNAYKKIKENGLNADDIKVMAGAAGGPKWLVLGGLDRLLFSRWFSGRKEPLFLIGSSIGTWRFAAASQQDPAAAIDRFEDAYIHQRYAAAPSAEEVSREAWKILDAILGDEDEKAAEILSHPFLRLNVMAVRCLHLTVSDRMASQFPGLMLAALSNAFSRRLLKLFFKRVHFHDTRDIPPFYYMNTFGIHHVGLTTGNLKTALLSSASIPLVMSGVRDIEGAPPGTYRDGGILDYHMDIPFLPEESGSDKGGIVLFPHYTDRIIPGWLDKKLSWRKPDPSHMKDVVLIAPSKRFLDSLPLGKIPDRNDFYQFKGRDAERIAYWKQAAEAGRNMAAEFMETAESSAIRKYVQPLDC